MQPYSTIELAATALRFVVAAYRGSDQRRDGDMMMEQPQWGFFRDDGTEINPGLIAKPSRCESCRKDDDPHEEIPCTLTRADQQGEEGLVNGLAVNEYTVGVLRH